MAELGTRLGILVVDQLRIHVPLPGDVANRHIVVEAQAQELDAASRAASSIGWLMVSLSSASPIALNGRCSLYLDPASVVTIGQFATDNHGEWGFQQPIPGGMSFLGLGVSFQAAILGSVYSGLDLTSGVATMLGD